MCFYSLSFNQNSCDNIIKRVFLDRCKNQPFYNIIKSQLLHMQAEYTVISQKPFKPLSLSWNVLSIKIQKSQKPVGKYKKVGPQVRQKLSELILQGNSIIKASKILNINYSTAKSILQNLKKTNSHRETSVSSSADDSPSLSSSVQL